LAEKYGKWFKKALNLGKIKLDFSTSLSSELGKNF